MAPSTAVLFALYGLAVVLRAQVPLRRGAYRIGMVVNSAGALVALLLFFLSLLGIRPEAEHLGFPAAGTVDGASVGHMSPVTAVGFLLASFSFLASLPSGSSRPWRARSAWGTAFLLIAVFAVLLLAYLYGTPFFYSGTFIPPAATTSAAFAALGIALLALAGEQAGPEGGAAETPAWVPYPLVLVFLLLTAGLVTVGGLFFRKSGALYRLEVGHRLAAIAELKASELARWRVERLGDASILLENSAFSALVRRAFDHPQDKEGRAQLREWLGKVEAHYEYDRVFLLDARGVERMSVPESRTPVSSVIARGTSEILRSRSVVFQDFYRDEYDRRVYLTVLVPVLEGRGGSRVLGIVGLRIDPEGFLYPFVRRWPVPSRTSETLIIRRDGTDALFLNELRFRSGTALRLRVPLANQENPAVKAALGQTGIVEGRDYRGVPVVAAVTAVPGSPWFLVARMDAAEANAPLRERLWMTIMLVGGLVAAAAGGVGALWRERHLRHFRERYEAEAVRRAHETLLAAVGEGVQVHDAEGRIISINESALRILGRTREDVAAGLLRSWDIVREDGTPFPTDAYPVAGTLRTGESVSGVVMGVRRPDGGVAWLKVSSRPLVRPGETKPYGAVATFADVTAYKETVEQLAAMTQQLWQTARLATMGELAASIAHELNNPLGTVNLRVESLLAQVPADDPKHRALEVIEQEAERMGNLVSGLLQFSRRSHRQVSTLDLRDEVKASLDLVRYHLRNRRVAVELGGAADVALVHADRQQLRQLFLNLFTNASDAMPEGGILRIRVTHGNGNVIVEVADTGVGISAENMERIFEPFFTTKPEGKGTGLGLAICRRIAQEHGGALDLTSEVGKGTTVRVTLPAAGAEGESES